MPSPRPVIVVSGLPRSGTSMAMQMLAAAGIPIVTDRERVADEDNPRGYFEFERVKQLKSDRSWLPEAEGKAVKVIHLLLTELPADRPYRVIFMQRDLQEVIDSQATMLRRSARTGAQLPADRLAAIYRQQLAAVDAWLAARPSFLVLRLEHRLVVQQPANAARAVLQFLEEPADDARVQAMAAAVDPSLHRNRSAPRPGG